MLSLIYYIFLVLLCTLFLLLSAVAFLLTVPFDKPRRVVHEFSRVLVRIFFAIPPMWRTKIEGMEHIDRDKSYVIVINHRAMTDIPTLYYLPLNFRWVSKREVFKLPFFGQFLTLHGDICIDRSRSAEAMEQLNRDGKMWLSRGVSVAIFPEGTRSRTGEINRFKAGAFMLAHEAGVEILPVVMDGTATLVKKNRLFNWRNKISIKVLKPISVDEVVATEPKEMMATVREQMAEAYAELRKKK